MSMEERNPRFFSPEEIIADFTRREDPRAGDTLEAPIPRRSIALFLVMLTLLYLMVPSLDNRILYIEEMVHIF